MKRTWFAAVVLAAVFSGCGPDRPETVTVRGTVTLDGQPVEGATVGFNPQGGGRPATGMTDSSGAFTLTTFVPGDGALPGKHAVTVSKVRSTGQQADATSSPDAGAMPLSGPIAAGGIKTEWLVPRKYSDPSSSGLVVEVRPGMEPVKLELKSQ